MNEENSLIREELQENAEIRTEVAEEVIPEETNASEQTLSQEEPLEFPEPDQTQDAEPNTQESEAVPMEENLTEEPADPEETVLAENAAETDLHAEEDGIIAEPEETDDSGFVRYRDRYYLRYHEGKRSMPMDIQGTREILRTIGFDGGALRQAREGKYCAELFRNADKNKSTQMYCSYCGAEINGVEFYHMPDGRMRCTGCSNSLIKDKAEAEALCNRVITNMEKFFGASVNVPVSVEMMDELKLKRKMGIPLGTKDTQSMLILGVAINRKKKYSIYLENGAPRISVIATFAHELTHIWQYTHWDALKGFRQCPPSKRLLIYEGMAKWAEIQYLYLIGETNVAKREEHITRNRNDEYGIGFRLYEEYYPLSRDTMSCESTPFVANKYPFA